MLNSIAIIFILRYTTCEVLENEKSEAELRW